MTLSLSCCKFLANTVSKQYGLNQLQNFECLMEFKNSGFLFTIALLNSPFLKKDDETTLLQVNSSDKNNKLLFVVTRVDCMWSKLIAYHSISFPDFSEPKRQTERGPGAKGREELCMTLASFLPSPCCSDQKHFWWTTLQALGQGCCWCS